MAILSIFILVYWFNFNHISTHLCLEVRESHSLYVHIYIFCAVVKKEVFTLGPIEYEYSLSKYI